MRTGKLIADLVMLAGVLDDRAAETLGVLRDRALDALPALNCRFGLGQG